MTQQEKYRIWELRQNGLGYKKIAKILNLNEDTVKSHIRRTSKKEPPKPVCEECGKVLIQMPKTKPRRFCSDRCKTQWWSKHPNAGNRSGFSFICEYCGKEFKSYASKTRRYCSTHCYAQARCKSNEKKGKDLSQKKHRAERNFRICLQIVNVLFVNGLLTEKESVRVKKKLIKICKPVTGILYDSKEWGDK